MKNLISLIFTITIEEIAEKIIDYRGKTPQKEKQGIKLITAKVIKDGYIVSGNHEYISENTYQTWMTRGIPKKGDVLITTEAPLGEVAQLRTSEKIALAQRVILIRGKPDLIDQTYLLYSLKTAFVQNQLYEKAVSTTVLGIKQSDLRKVKIPLPPLEEQKRIAKILTKADKIRRTRRYALELSDTYLQSVFLEMFGDPVTNPMGWDTIQLGDRLTFLTSGSRGYAKYYSQKGDIFLRVENVSKSRLLLDDLVFVQPPENAESRRITVKTQDLLVTMTADLGRSAVIPDNLPKAYINQHIGLLRLKNMNPVFVSGYISTPQGNAQFKALDKGGVKSGLNFDDVRSYKVFSPPLKLQEKFAKIVQKYERIRKQQQEAQRQADHLFQSLLHQFFSQ